MHHLQGYTTPVSENHRAHPHTESDEPLNMSPLVSSSQTATLQPAMLNTDLSAMPECNPMTMAETMASGIPAITSDMMPTSFTMNDMTPATEAVNPALLLARYEKRKSSPAVLGLPFGLSDSEQFNMYLSHQRNSIEAAMLLANFNRTPAKHDGTGESDKATLSWQDDMAHTTQQHTPWQGQQTTVDDAMRRHSYDVNMSWKTMPSSFRERSDYLPTLAESSASPNSVQDTSSTFYDQDTDTAEATAKLTWTQDGVMLSNTPSNANDVFGQAYEFMAPTAIHYPDPTMTHPLTVYQTQQKYAPDVASNFMQPTMTYPQPYQHQFAQPLPGADPTRQTNVGYYPFGGQGTSAAMANVPPVSFQAQTTPKLQLPPSAPSASVAPGVVMPPAKRQKSRANGEGDEGTVVEPGDADFPDMSQRDVEAAKNDPNARPRKQKLRFAGDKYTPQWVRYNGQAKEGLCNTCSPGKWLQLKNSAFWYHKQFFHGISSVSGKEFLQPLETRWVDQDLVEGLCHQCRQWVAVSNVKRKNSVLWYRHAHKCHVYHKPKSTVPKKRV